MDILSQFTQISSEDGQILKGGIRFKGLSRNTRQPVHLMLLVDTSGSMNTNDKLSSVKRSIQTILEFMSAEDRLSLVTFDNVSKTILSCVTPSAEEREAIKYRIATLSADGSTNLSAGLLDMRSLVEDASSGRKQGLIILTDGHVNMGMKDPAHLQQLVEHIIREKPGLAITTVGYGVEHNTDLLKDLAQSGTGSYNVVMNLEDVATLFGDILGGLVTVSVQNLAVQLPPGAETFTSYRTVRQDDGITSVFIGDIYAEAEATVMFAMSRAMGPILIKGVNMNNLEVIQQIVRPDAITDVTQIDISFILADLRQKVTNVLSNFRNHTTTSATVEELINEIQQNDRIRDHPLTAMLIEDLQNLLPLLRTNHTITQEEDANISQHAAFFGMARGFRSLTSPVRVMGSNAVHQSPFATNTQSQYSQAMRTASLQVDNNA